MVEGLRRNYFFLVVAFRNSRLDLSRTATATRNLSVEMLQSQKYKWREVYKSRSPSLKLARGKLVM